MEMIEQKRYIDDNEGTSINEFLDDIIEKHKLREFNYTEVNYFFNEDALEKCKKSKERVERKIKELPEN